jgi:hypothetical protein
VLTPPQKRAQTSAKQRQTTCDVSAADSSSLLPNICEALLPPGPVALPFFAGFSHINYSHIRQHGCGANCLPIKQPASSAAMPLHMSSICNLLHSSNCLIVATSLMLILILRFRVSCCKMFLVPLHSILPISNLLPHHARAVRLNPAPHFTVSPFLAQSCCICHCNIIMHTDVADDCFEQQQLC